MFLFNVIFVGLRVLLCFMIGVYVCMNRGDVNVRFKKVCIVWFGYILLLISFFLVFICLLSWNDIVLLLGIVVVNKMLYIVLSYI